MNNENIQQEEGLSLLDLFKIFKNHIIFIVLSVIICFGGGIAVSMMLPPSYEASQKVYIQNIESTGTNSDLITGGLRIIDTFTDFITDTSVAKLTVQKINATDKLSEDLEDDYYKVIKENLKTSTSSSNTICVTISYTCNNDLLGRLVIENVILSAQEIAAQDSVFDLFKNSITTGVSNDLLGNGDVAESEEDRPSKVLYGAIGIVLGGIIGVAYALIAETLDNTIKSKKFVEDKFGIKVIGAIPEISEGKKNEKSK